MASTVKVDNPLLTENKNSLSGLIQEELLK